MFCTRCGNQISERDNFCTGCGSPISFSESEEQKKARILKELNASDSQNPKNVEKKKLTHRGKIKKILSIVGSILFIIWIVTRIVKFLH